MTDRERTITKLKILRTWCVVNPDHGKGLCVEDCRSAVEWLDDVLALLKAQPTVDGWISVKDRLPDEKENWITKDYQKVICCCDFGGDPQRIDVRTYGFGNGHFWHGPQIMDGVITHWMPLPEPPKEDNDAEQ